MLTTVTLTGADDTTDPLRLVELSSKYQFVEWGILIGTSSGKGSRFPSQQWLSTLESVIRHDSPGLPVPRLSLHICGAYLRAILNHGTSFLNSTLGFQRSFWTSLTHLPWRRMQFNTHGQHVTAPQQENLRGFMSANRGQAFIIQLDGVNNHLLAACAKLASSVKVAGLHDLSSGAGIKPDSWPEAHSQMGYAGGLGPDGLDDDIANIKKAAGRQLFWIDMETSLRSQDGKDIFDLDRCERVLRTCAPIIADQMLQPEMPQPH